MGTINTSFNDRVRYTLKNKHYGSLVIIEPIGWEDDEKEYSRNMQYHGIVAKFSNSLKFIEDGGKYIQLVLDTYGINEEIKLIREEKHPHTDLWTLTYYGYLDLSTWAKENNQLSVKFNSGGLEQLLKSREGENIEIDRLTTIDGGVLDELKSVNVSIEGREIFLNTNYKVKEVENNITLNNAARGTTRGSTYCIPLKLVNKSHEEAHSPIAGTMVQDNYWERTENGETGLMFFAISERNRFLRVKFTLKFKATFAAYRYVNFFMFFVRLAQYRNGIDYNIKLNRFLFSTGNPLDVHNRDFSFTFDEVINVEIGDSLALVLDQNFDGRNGQDAYVEISVTNIECDLTIDEDSSYEKTTTKAVLMHEFVDRLVNITTNKKNSFYSDFLGRVNLNYQSDGDGAYLACTHGFWVRGFDKLPIPSEEPKVENLFKPLTTSFKDCITSLNSVFNIGIGIEKVGYSERIRLEGLEYFYNRNVTINLQNQVKKVKRSIATELIYSSVTAGYEKGGIYKEAFGLDEFNAKSNYTTTISRIKNELIRLSKYRADSYGMEFARRKNIFFNKTEDTPYDKDVFFLDLKQNIDGLFTQRKWQDDLEKPPTGIFSPNTATNLRFSPLNNILRMGWVVSSGLIKYPTDYFRYGSSTANSKLTTKLIGKNEYSENKDILNSKLTRPIYAPEWIEFEYICDFEVMQQIEGSTTILGKEVPNFYGLVKFINENNETEYGFLFNLKPNKSGNWKVLKANK